MNITGAVASGDDLLEVTNTGTGNALSAGNTAGGAALAISSGSVRAVGAGVGSNTFSTIHQVNASGAFGAGGTLCATNFPSYSVLDNPHSNNEPNAMLYITPRSPPLSAAAT